MLNLTWPVAKLGVACACQPSSICAAPGTQGPANVLVHCALMPPPSPRWSWNQAKWSKAASAASRVRLPIP